MGAPRAPAAVPQTQVSHCVLMRYNVVGQELTIRLAVLPRLHRRHRHRQPLLLHPLLLPLRPRLRPPAELEAPRTSLL